MLRPQTRESFAINCSGYYHQHLKSSIALPEDVSNLYGTQLSVLIDIGHARTLVAFRVIEPFLYVPFQQIQLPFSLLLCCGEKNKRPLAVPVPK